MRSRLEHKDLAETPEARDLNILSEIEANPEVTQRQLAQRAGIALGLTNILLRSLVQKGYVRATKANWRQWLYALTPDGFSHKVRLTVSYVNRVLNHYQNVRQTLRKQLEPLSLHSESSIAILGTADFAELVYLGLRELGIEEIEIFRTQGMNGNKFLGLPVRDVATLQPESYDYVVIADLTEAQSVKHRLLASKVEEEKLVIFFAGTQSPVDGQSPQGT